MRPLLVLLLDVILTVYLTKHKEISKDHYKQVLLIMMSVLENPQKWLNLDLYVSDMSWIITTTIFFQKHLQKTNSLCTNRWHARDINIKNLPELPENDLVVIISNLRTTDFIFDIGINFNSCTKFDLFFQIN